MFIEGTDHDEGVVVWIFAGETNDDADYRAYCESITRFERMTSERKRVAVLVVDPSSPMPDARWRREIADRSRNIRPNTIFVLVGNAVARGVATAINWIRPPTYEMRTAASFVDALALAEASTGRSLPRLRELHDEARERIRARGA